MIKIKKKQKIEYKIDNMSKYYLSIFIIFCYTKPHKDKIDYAYKLNNQLNDVNIKSLLDKYSNSKKKYEVRKEILYFCGDRLNKNELLEDLYYTMQLLTSGKLKHLSSNGVKLDLLESKALYNSIYDEIEILKNKILVRMEMDLNVQ